MSFSIEPSGPEDEDLTEHFFQCLGRALYAATLFEQKCSWVSWIGQMVHEIRRDPNFRIPIKEPHEPDDKPPRLNSSINALLKVASSESAQELAVLHRGRAARNKIAHELSNVGPLGGLRSKRVKKALDSLRTEVETLAQADVVASSWAYAIQEQRDAPSWLRENYARRLVDWVFGGPHDALDADRLAHEAALYERLTEMARTAMKCPCCDDESKLRYRSETNVQCGRGHLFDLNLSGTKHTITVVTAGTPHDIGTAFAVPPHVTFQ